MPVKRLEKLCLMARVWLNADLGLIVITEKYQEEVLRAMLRLRGLLRRIVASLQ